MSVKFFGQYLIEQKAILREDLFCALSLQKRFNLRLGDIILEMGLMTKEQLNKVLLAQRHEDLRFGDMAIKMGYLKPEQIAMALAKQRENYLFIGEALVKLGVLTQQQLQTFLEQYHQDHAHQNKLKIEIPAGVPHREIWEMVVDMNCKMLTRIAGLSIRLGPGRQINHCPSRQVTVMAGLTGDVNAHLLFSLSKKTSDLIACRFLSSEGERGYPDMILDVALKNYFNLVCENIVSKAVQLNHKIDLISARVRLESEEVQQSGAERGLRSRFIYQTVTSLKSQSFP